MSNEEIIISVVVAILVVFSLVVSIVIPARDPNFPGKRNLVTFGIICLVLVGGTLATVEVYGAEEGHGAEIVGEGEAEAGGGAVEPEPPPAEGAPAEAPPAAPAGDAEAGAGIFVSASCGSCHTLGEAGSTGNIGPNLDESSPAFDLVVDRVTNGAGAMPAFAGQLSPAEIDDVAAYVVAASG